MVTYKRTVTTEADVATTISRAPAVRVAAEEKIHCPSLHLKLSKIRLQLKDNVHTLLYISNKRKWDDQNMPAIITVSTWSVLCISFEVPSTLTPSCYSRDEPASPSQPWGSALLKPEGHQSWQEYKPGKKKRTDSPQRKNKISWYFWNTKIN